MIKVDAREWPWQLNIRGGESGTEYAEISACCQECEDAGMIQEGHFSCWAEPMPGPEWEAIRGPILVAGTGWRLLIARRAPQEVAK